ncbi:MAG: hypothetical protein HN591_07640 [Flavobacteriales bacterium]|jgi:hypothetical protein|nr:hypothetical protein [Flavobacteriales bacterium]
MRKPLLFSALTLLCCLSSGAQTPRAELTTAVDSLSVLIGAQLNYTLQIKADSTDQVLFPERTSFLPFEIIEDFPMDTLKAQTHYLYTKKYALIQFDSGRYWMPQQRIIVNGQSLLSDSIEVEVRDVVVDTLKQKMYAIKPLIEVERNYDKWIRNLLWALLILILGLGGFYSYFVLQKRKREREQQLPPFDQALHDLKSLEARIPSNQEEFKSYYSKLTDIVRRYLEEEAKVDALESTSDELLQKLELLQDAGKITLQTETLKNLKRVLGTADLVKFARSLPEHGIAAIDRELVEEVVIDTQKGLPKPTFEEMQQKAAYQKLLRQQKLKKRIRIIGLTALGLLLITFTSSVLYYGYYPVRDTLVGYPTKKLDNNQWVTSMYGTPPIRMSTPRVLKRVESMDANVFKHFVLGTPDDVFFMAMKFSEKPKKEAESKEENSSPNVATEVEVQAIIDATIENYQKLGATNILINSEVITTASGIPALKIYGTLDYPRKGENQRIRNNYTSLIFDFEEGKIEITLMYGKEDRYGSGLEERIVNSVELIKEL